MTAGPDRDPDTHDRELAATWREHSRERPPASLDAAILAAAHRAVGARPGKASADALRPPQWWLPFAAAAVIGVVAVGVVQLAPHEAAIDPGSGQAASARMEVATAPAARTEGTAAPAARPEAAAASPSTPAASATNDQVEARKAAATSAAEPARPTAEASRADSRQKLAVATPPPPPAPASPPPASPAPAPAPMMQAKPDVSAAATPPKITAPSPVIVAPPVSMPAAPPPMAAAAPAPEPFPAGRSMAPRDEQGFSRDVPTRGGRIVPMPAELPQKDTTVDAGKGIASAPAPAPAPAPAAASRAASNESAAINDRLRESKQKQEADMSGTANGALSQFAKPSQLAKERVPARAEALEHAKDPDAWIIRIRKLRDGGRTTEAVEELREFDALVPDAQRRMPAELRRFLERENAKR